MKTKAIIAAVSAASLLMLVLTGARLYKTSTAQPVPTTTFTALTPPPDLGVVREPAVAGAFYPGDAGQLAAMVDSFLEAVQGIDGEPIAIIVPHAGYVYSGWVAAYAYKQLQGTTYDTIVIIGPSHSVAFDGISVFAEGAFETPLGYVPIDTEVAQALLQADERIVFDPEVHGPEHSIEVQLPFLQRIYENFKIVPIIMGQPTEENIDALAEALVQALANKKALVIASSDMSHYPAYEDAVRVDSRTLMAIETMDPEALRAMETDNMTAGTANLVTCLCGEGPVLTAMKVARRLGANQTTVLKYANSGDSPLVEGDKSRVVGYGAVMLWRYEPPNLSATEKAALLDIARQSIAQYLEDGSLARFDVSEPELLRKSGAFVTLEQRGELRGCIGQMVATQPLYATVQQAAVSAATQDPRFPPLTLEELNQITIEISVLSPLSRVRELEDIQVGKHGLLIASGGQQGVLLPQVATEEGWTREEFLRGLCRKAGLPEDAWQHGAALYTFTAIVFGESG
jgi:AmmeMemoRadiSam system protein B/AmmeMemoRadiSam system protein A